MTNEELREQVLEVLWQKVEFAHEGLDAAWPLIEAALAERDRELAERDREHALTGKCLGDLVDALVEREDPVCPCCGEGHGGLPHQAFCALAEAFDRLQGLA